jgi:mannose-6-phosphate isomerase
MQPFLLLPEFVERPWGTRDLSLVYPHKTARRGGEFEDPVGEVWLTGDMCRVSTGPLQGRTLADITKQFNRELVGEAAPDPHQFPLLTKFLFPKEKLSVQVHPDDATARRHGFPHGKSECWYVMAAEIGTKVALGLNESALDHAQLAVKIESAVQSNTLEDLLKWVEVHAGEMVNVPAGTVHSIGPGCILVEVQQNSDLTYRLYDYGRPRELHIQRALESIQEPNHAGKVARLSEITPFGSVALLNSTENFMVEKFLVRSEAVIRNTEHNTKSSVRVVIGLEGCGILEFQGGPSLTLAKGEVAVIPADVNEFGIRPQWALECLSARVPS